jgi:hypothetical protein
LILNFNFEPLNETDETEIGSIEKFGIFEMIGSIETGIIEETGIIGFKA